MKSVLISIRPKWVEKIASGKKTIEVRKTTPKEAPFKVYIYATRPKEYYKCGAVSTSDELLWLANGKIKMGDGFELLADGEDYQCVNGKVIGEFICYNVDEFYEWELSPQGKFAESEEDRLKRFLSAACLLGEEVVRYRENLPYFKPLYGWNISDLKIYEKPKELSEFFTIAESGSDCCCGCVWNETPLEEMPCRTCTEERKYLSRPPKSWQYVEKVD